MLVFTRVRRPSMFGICIFSSSLSDYAIRSFCSQYDHLADYLLLVTSSWYYFELWHQFCIWYGIHTVKCSISCQVHMLFGRVVDCHTRVLHPLTVLGCLQDTETLAVGQRWRAEHTPLRVDVILFKSQSFVSDPNVSLHIPTCSACLQSHNPDILVLHIQIATYTWEFKYLSVNSRTQITHFIVEQYFDTRRPKLTWQETDAYSNGAAEKNINNISCPQTWKVFRWCALSSRLRSDPATLDLLVMSFR